MKYHTLMQRDLKSWTPWTTPAVKYKLACCSCGLVHDIQFMVRLKGGKNLDRRKGQIKFRVRQNILSTAAVRREMSRVATSKPAPTPSRQNHKRKPKPRSR